jgi:23S rRNA (cytidine1920-2'-O)/16S rRNA (cytidine1409-2'-O)-methyltransferase
VRIKSDVVSKPGHTYPADAAISVDEPPRYVGRGGEKLEFAIAHFAISVDGRIAIDVGASTGGFTDCMLQHGAARVYAIDVGKGQLHWKLRNDPRVISMEEFNARDLRPEDLPEAATFGTADVSFISLTRILTPLRDVLTPGSDLVTLIKPQFEAGPKHVRRGGVVRDEAVRAEVVERIRVFGTEEAGLSWRGVCESPVKGPAGNVEYLAWWNRT